MKLTPLLISVVFLSIVNSIAFAATDSTQITTEVTKQAYVKLVGSLADSKLINLSLDDVDNKLITLGTLGSESNTVGLCEVAFSSDNDFKFQHKDDPAFFLHGSNQYRVFWKGTMIASGRPNIVHLTTCNPYTQAVTMRTPDLPSVVRAGVYSDTLRMTISTQ